jgi:hypothetical protein
VQCLTELKVTSDPVPRSHSADRFGQLLSLHDSVNLLEMLEELPDTKFESTGISIETVKDEFVGAHAALVDFIAKSFVPRAGRARGKLPTPEAYHSHCRFTQVYVKTRSGVVKNHTAAYEPYRKFYVERQDTLATKINRLRFRIADAISGVSPELAQLASLDKGIGDALFVQSQQIFAAIPNLLGRRFRRLLDEHWHELPNRPAVSDLEPWMRSGGWISGFCGEMQEMLLAELEIRLQPVLGLIETLCDAIIGGNVRRKVNAKENRNSG